MDWNDDGLEDIIVGDRNGYITYFRRTGGGANDLTEEGNLEAGGSTIDVGSNSAPVCVYVHADGSRERLDWNEDGLCDMLVGLQGSYPSGSNLRVYLNEGSNSSPVFGGYENISGDYGYRFCPHVVDLNGDGKKDVVAGNYSANIVYYENVGTNAAPEFGSGENLQAAGSDIELSSGTRLWVDDWNSDGLLDLLVSDYDGYVCVFLQAEEGLEQPESGRVEDALSMVAAGNPCRGAPAVRLTLPSAMQVEIAVYDCLGRRMGGIEPGGLSAGQHLLDLPVEPAGSGVLFVRCRAGGTTVTERITVLAP